MDIKKIAIPKEYYDTLKVIVNFANDYYSTSRDNHILLTEPNTLQTFKIKNSNLIEAIGDYRKTYLTIRRRLYKTEIFGLKFEYAVIMILR